MTKSELGTEAQALVKAGRVALRPTLADRQRVLSALSERVSGDYGSGHSGAPPAPPAAPAPVARGLGAKALYATASALAAFGVLASLAFTRPERETQPPSTPPTKPVLAAVPAPAPAPNVDATKALESPSPVATPEVRGAAAKRSADSLAEEVSILSRAETELHAGRAASALALLQEHQRKFPRGALVEERIAARIQALCALGRVSEAEASLSRLKRLSPESPHEKRAREACAPNAKH